MPKAPRPNEGDSIGQGCDTSQWAQKEKTDRCGPQLSVQGAHFPIDFYDHKSVTSASREHILCISKVSLAGSLQATSCSVPDSAQDR
jgi:hypothetical protein